MFTNFYVQCGDVRECVQSDDPREAALQALTSISDEMEDSSLMPRVETLIRVSPNGWQEEIERVDKDVIFIDTAEILKELEYFDVLSCMEREEQDEWDATFNSRPESQGS